MADSSVQALPTSHSFPIANLWRGKNIAQEADQAGDKDGKISIDEMEAYAGLLDRNAANAEGTIRDELTRRAAAVRDAIEDVRTAQRELINQPREVHDRLIAIARAAVAEAVAGPDTTPELRAKWERRLGQAIAKRDLSRDERDAVERLSRALLRGAPKERYSNDRLFEQPAFRDAVTQAQTSLEEARRNEVLRARTALGVQVSAPQDNPLAGLQEAQVAQAKALVGANRGKQSQANIDASLVPQLTGEDDGARARANLVLQGLLVPNYHYTTCSMTNPWSEWGNMLESLVWLGSSRGASCMWTNNHEEERGGLAKVADKEAYAAHLVERLTPEQLRALEPGTVRALAGALTRRKSDRDEATFFRTEQFAQLTSEWSFSVRPGDGSEASRRALTRLLGALPRSMWSRSEGDKSVEIGFNATSSVIR